MDEESAYSSKLTLHFGASSGPIHARPGDITDADDEHLHTLKNTVALPVVTSLLREEELQQLTLHWGIDGDPGDVWITITAAGETFQDLLSSPSWHGGDTDGEQHSPFTAQECAQRLASHLEDWITESRFGWGQQRIARYTLPQL
ncbi:hypothetical protein [Kineococcus radiotolerans]|uniref:Uncharacterized protein n=1 Tax=Kineococcus radiotolerans (strain ATCC BAA-149 / DSM 14245 / SRS30216) TaxID=266940 RepID=A6WAM9_KINRD|nr:hypothetical protein [Kineococcus radiotolerans]ABS03868.1 hypothetical protein Krad_2388 [Kineococcus radiotolerans SRS30216 = ATCC BAA-149]